jgi:cytoskeletal protein CcmA (bactofilin family)
MSNFRPAEKDVVYIGEGVTFAGAVKARRNILVDGSIEGETGGERLIVGERGVVKGAISVTSADVSGTAGADISVR